MALKKSELYSSLGSSCDELRGGMDASQSKDYVLVLLFIKYVSDKYAGQPFAPITIPPGASFADMVALTTSKIPSPCTLGSQSSTTQRRASSCRSMCCRTLGIFDGRSPTISRPAKGILVTGSLSLDDVSRRFGIDGPLLVRRSGRTAQPFQWGIIPPPFSLESNNAPLPPL